MTKTSDEDKNSQNSQNTENTQEQEPEENQPPSDSQIQDSEIGMDENDDTVYVPDAVYVKTTTQVRLRKEPNTSCATLDRIDGGTKLEVLETLDGWYKVNYNGQDGYVCATYTEIVEE